MSEFGAVTAVIPQWNRADLLAQLLKHLSQQTYPIDNVIVADNGSTDDSAGVAERAGAAVIRMGTNAGFAAAVNRGIEAARTDWVLILNNDVLLSRDWLRTLIRGAGERRMEFAVGKLLSADRPDVIDGTFDAVCRGGTALRCGHGRPDGPVWRRSREVQFAPLTAALFRREVFERVGLLDERFESYLEDVDLGLRCARAGLKGLYVPAAEARHIGSATLGAWHKDTVRRMARNQMFLIAKHFGGAPRLPIMAAQVLWGLIALRHGCGWAYLRGKWEGWRASRQIRPADGWPAIRRAVEASEREIRELQQLTGADTYWRWYFALSGGARI